MSDWENAQSWELKWHHDCINSFHEEEKQLVYAEKMGLVRTPTPKTPYNFNLEGKSILDIGGGAYSLLLKCSNFAKGDNVEGGTVQTSVIDPLMDKHPRWVKSRYNEAGIFAKGMKGEDINPEGDGYWDEVWIYNVLEHTEDPEKIIRNALSVGKIIRIFEWVNTRVNEGHIHSLKEEELNLWLGGEGKTEYIKRGGAVGQCYYGIFKGKSYVAPSNN